MARLKAHGTELLRVEYENDSPKSDLITYERVTRAYMSDGQILQKRDVRFKPDSFGIRKNGEFYSYGWKRHAKVKKGHTIQEVIASALKAIANKPDTKWKVVSGGLPPVVIDQKRIMAALESGESTGFCKACGAETDGVEPDARNYRCGECGQHEVCGAEEMLVVEG